jgi:hypothetical protein
MKALWTFCVILMITFWTCDSSEMQDNLGEKAVIESDTLTIIDYTCYPYPFPQTYEFDNGAKLHRLKAKPLIISQ